MSDVRDEQSVGEASPVSTPIDPAAAAFEALREEVALIRRAVAGLAAERASIDIPDYSETLGKILRASAATAASLKTLSGLPALRATPNDMARDIAAAGEQARRTERTELADAKATFKDVAQNLATVLRSARGAEAQNRWLLITGAGGVLAGMLLWAFVSGPLVRAAPESWHWPEHMAAYFVGTDQETAGERLIATAAPNTWRDIVLGYRIIDENRNAIMRCERNRSKSARNIQCVIEIAP